jgi:acylphosphatase
MEKVKVHIFISGRVQGVFYRNWTKNNATKLGLTGWVRNLPGGRVEAVFEGEKEKVEEMIKRCKKGPKIADVQKVEIRWGKYSGDLGDFRVRD